DRDIMDVLEAITKATPAGAPLFPYTLARYRKLMKEVEASLGLSAGWGPHSPRAGWASDSRAEGLSFEEVRERGRWIWDASLRIYLDIAGASHILTQLNTRGFAQQLYWLKRGWIQYFPASVFDVSSGMVRDRNTGQWGWPQALPENVSPLPQTPGTPGSWMQIQSPASSGASRAATPPGPVKVFTPPSATSPGTPPPSTTLAAVPTEAAGHIIPGGLKFVPQGVRAPATRVAKGSRVKAIAGFCKVVRPALGPCFCPLIVLVALFVVFPASVFPNFTRSADAAAHLVEDVAGAGGAVALAARNFTMAVSS
ncbi:unnamed protein product, partial [Prorocentrum cordatum]